ncbi:Ig-like domain-containing protein [Parabacteroides sp. AF48-14]|uniref:Ig-like domain-containing protein n=2 Tax=unclassified Parabacteroides TaxID=2649774 RepID=UPI0013145EBF|nr:Ig-like domain-containing protein [Parabacteroides sp. AF48-14]
MKRKLQICLLALLVIAGASWALTSPETPATIGSELHLTKADAPVVYGITTTKGDAGNINVQVKFEVISVEGIDLANSGFEYYEPKTSSWVTATLEEGKSFVFGAAEGFSLQDATSYFRITPKGTGTMVSQVEVINVANQEAVATKEDRLDVTADAQNISITKGETTTYYGSLYTAVLFAEANDVIQVPAGEYDLRRGMEAITDPETNGKWSGWYLPIQKPLTIQGAGKGKTILTSSTEALNNAGDNNQQDFITVFPNATGTVLKDMTIISKSEANKAIHVFGKDFEMSNVALFPAKDKNNFAGSIYFQSADGDGTIKLTDVELNQGRLSFSGTTKANVTLENVAIDYTQVAIAKNVISTDDLQDYPPIGSVTGKSNLNITAKNVSVLLAANDGKYQPDAETFNNMPAGTKAVFTDGTYSFADNLTISQSIALEGTANAKLQFTNGGLIVDANDVALNNLNIETKAGAPVTINASKTGFTLNKGLYSRATLAGSDVKIQGESALRFMSSNGAINVTGATLVGGIYVENCTGSLAGVKGNSISYTYEGPVSFVGISATFSGTNASAAVVSVADLAAQNTIKMPATGMQYDVTFENSGTSPWTKFAYVVSGVPAVKDNKINLTAGSDVAYNGVVLQRAIDYAAAQSEKPEIILGAGTYQGCFIMADGVNVTGADKATTILDGNAKGRVVSYKADAAYDGSAFTEAGLKNATTWSNLKITNGKADNAAGAIITKNVTLKNCEISANATEGKAGGVMCYMGGVVDGCLIHNNKAASGGGVVMHFIGTIQNSEVYNNTVTGDNASAHSGGINTRTNIENIDNDASNMQILNCKVYGNTAYNIAGVGLNGKATMVNTLVYGNTATGSKGVATAEGKDDTTQGAVEFSVAGAKMVNCTVWGNKATLEGAEANVSAFDNSQCTIINSVMETVTNSTVKGGTITYSASASLETDAEVTHNIKIENYDPFTNASAGDYTLADGSKFANKGSNEAYAAAYPKTDLAGKTRIQETTIDLGAYESAYKAAPVNTEEALKEELAKKPAEIVIEAPEDGKAELTIKEAIEIDYPVTITSSDEKPVTIQVEEGKSAFTTKEGGELTLDNVTIATTETTSGSTETAPVIKIETGSEATLQNSTLEVPATVTAIEASGKMTISGVDLTVKPVEGGVTAAPVINVAKGGDVTIDNAAITDGTIEVTGTLTIEPAEKKEVVFTQTSEDKPALDLKDGANVTVTNAQFTGKAVEAASGAIINFSNCNFSSPKESKAVRMTRSTGDDGNATVIDAGDATATIEGCIFTEIKGTLPMLYGKNLTVKSCLFYDNEDMVMIEIIDGGASTIANNTCVNNNENAESAIISNALEAAVIKNNILWTNTDEAIAGNHVIGDNISHNALKTAAETVATNSLKLTTYDYIMFNNTNHKYQLHKDSPVAKAQGDITAVAEGAMDILGDARLTDDDTNKTVHFGAYESVYTPTTGGGSTGGGTGDTTPDATGIKLDKTTLTLARLQSYTLIATVEPAAAGGVKWTSTDPSVATVNANGKVTAVKVGQATIIATAINGGLTALCQVTVDFATSVEEALAESAIFGREGGIQIQPATPVEMIIVNMAGTVVAHRTISQAETISVPKGIYIVRLSSGGHVLTQKVNVR